MALIGARKISLGFRRAGEIAFAPTLPQENSDDLLVAAEKITRKLGGPGNLMVWLRSSVGTLQPTNRDVLEAIATLGVPIMTTNYDKLLEEVTDQPSVDWQDEDKVQ